MAVTIAGGTKAAATNKALYGKGFYSRIGKKGGSPVNEHIEEQAHMGLRLIEAGYKFDFAIGFEESKKLIEEYLELKK